MRKLISRILIGLGVVIVVLVVGLVVFIYSIDFRFNPSKMEEAFQEAGLKPPEYVVSPTYSYLDNRREENQIVIFVHGAPGSAADFMPFLKLPDLSSYRLICLERQGYGRVGYGQVETSIWRQADYLNKFIEMLPDSSEIYLVGHSYGCPVVMAAAAVSDSGRINGLVLAAGLMSAEEEKIFWFNPLLDIPFLRKRLPDFVRMSNDEKMAHADMLAEVESLWSKVSCPTYVLHGDKDWIAPVSNAYYLDSLLSNRSNYHLEILRGGNHILQMNAREEICQAIDWVVHKSQK